MEVATSLLYLDASLEDADFDGAPVLAVRIQELYGATQTPRVGHTAIQLQLLSPNNRIQQVTDEIAESLSIKPARGALIAGVRGGSSAAFTGTDPAGGSITYTSDAMFGLDYSNTTARDFAITLGSISNPTLSTGAQVGFDAKSYTGTPTAALTTFRASANGTFGSSPSPSVPAWPRRRTGW